ncbi:hypothetical protein [Pseudoalteromonas piscicida]|uniref:hypothetical protein n=1 Tax=Pseudoalteromonas piscicida TaxID=43662 RepID=UPI003C7A3E0D
MIKKQGAMAIALLALTACSSNFQLPTTSTSPVVAGELDKTMYLRGDFTLWDAEPQYRFEETQPGIYATKARFMSPGKVYEFKIADEQWSEGYNCGYKREGQLTLGQPLVADCNTVYNYFSFKPSKKGWYEIRLDYRNPRSPKVVIVKS